MSAGPGTPIGVLVAEDSAVTREYLVHLLGQDGTLRVVAACRNGLEAVEQVERLRPDVVLMDVHMPGLDGYQATRRIMERVPTPIVMMSATLTPEEAATSFETLSAGALTLVAKPAGPDDPRHQASVRHLFDTLKLVAGVKVVRRFPRRPPPAAPAPRPAAAGRRVRVVTIGASTGGPQVLAEILQALPDDFPLPVLVVQHIAPGFVGGLVAWLGQLTGLTVKVAEAGEALRPATVYVAPDGLQMGVAAGDRIRLARETAEDGFCPSASYLFATVAEAYGRAAAGVLLSGMGRDGAAGLGRLRQAGGLTIAQDPESCVVSGMPGEAVRLGAAEHVLPPERIAAALRALAPAG